MLRRVFSYLLVVAAANGNILRCNRTLKGTVSTNLENYIIEISGNPSNYAPGEQYTGKEITYSTFISKFTSYSENDEIQLNFKQQRN